MPPRMKNPAMVLPDAMQAILKLNQATRSGAVPAATLELAHLRASQINGCSSCVYAGSRQAKRAGETDERLFAVAAWRDSLQFNDAERAALALTEAVTRLSEQADPVPDDVWEQAQQHYDEPALAALAALILAIATTNVFNRLNVTTRQIPGAWG